MQETQKNIPKAIWLLSLIPVILLISLSLIIPALNLTSITYVQLRYCFISLVYIFLLISLIYNKNLSQSYNFDKSTFAILILAGILRIDISTENEFFYKIIINILSFLLLVAFIWRIKEIPSTNLFWVNKSLLIGVLVIPLSLLESFNVDKYIISNSIYNSDFYRFIGYSIKNFLYQLSFVVPFEEVVIRGIFWQFLRNQNFSEKRIFIVQGLLFWGLHFFQIVYPISFFISLPIVIFVESLLTKYSKQLFPSIVFHFLVNVLVPIFVSFISK